MLRFGLKKIEASQYFGRLGAPKPGEASIFLGYIKMQKRWEAPKDSNDSIFWKSWKTSRELKEIEASQHFETLGASKPREAPKDSNDSIFWKSWKTSRELKEIEASQHFETLGLPNLERPQSFRGSKLKKIEASQHFRTLGAPQH